MIYWNLNKIMKAKSICTYLELSERSGLSHILITLIGRNKQRNIQLSELNTLCKVLECPPADLLEYKED